MRDQLSLLTKKYLNKPYYFLYNLRNEWRIMRQDIFKYKYNKDRYPGLFLQNDYAPFPDIESKVDRIIYCFWTGDNEMSENRKRGFQSLIENSGIEVVLITPKNLHEYILPDHPLHPAYENLSLVHKSDYLRCYFMHFHGGGYCDIKPNLKNWSKAFELLVSDENYWVLGTTEADGFSMGKGQGVIDKDLQYYYRHCIGTCAFICKSNTKITTEWYLELLKRMDEFEEKLKRYPGDVKGRNKGYPITLHGVLSQIWAPICLKYKEKIIHFDIFPTRDNYQ